MKIMIDRFAKKGTIINLQILLINTYYNNFNNFIGIIRRNIISIDFYYYYVKNEQIYYIVFFSKFCGV